MKNLILLCVIISCVAYVLCETKFVERETAMSVPSGWTLTNEKENDSPRILKTVFMLKQRNLAVLKKIFWEVSNPRHAKYGKYLSLQEISDLVAPSEESIERVVSFLKSQNVEDVSVTLSRDMIVAKMCTGKASKIFNVKYDVYKHTSGISSKCSLGPYSLPAEIADLVDFVSGVVGFPEIDRPRVVRGPDAGLDIDPTVIRTRYNISAKLVSTHPSNSHAVAEFQAQYYSPSDLQAFWKALVPFAPFRAVDSVVGFNDPNNPGIEASLDIQYLMGVAPNCTTWFYSMKSFNFWDDLTSWASLLNNETTLPYVHSISYGEQVASAYPTATYQTRLDAEFQKLGVRGITIIFASGDSGAGCVKASGSCSCSLSPAFPATSEYVTAIGATKFLAGNSGEEGAVSAFLSGGGFANGVFTTGSFQQTAVGNYFKQAIKFPPDCAYNKSGRGTPDASALGDIHFQVYEGGKVTSVGGTSAAAPTFAAVITLLNDIRLHAAKPTLGYLNQWIYQTAAANPSAFFDVTVGSNAKTLCCGVNQGGYQCTTGWDPVTGVGTPNFAELSKLV